MKVRDLIALEIDIDVYDDVCEELGIAMCGPVVLTPEGQEHFAEVMDYEVTINNGSYMTATVHVDDDEDKVWKRRLKKAIEFFHSAAGYCSCDDYDKWFKDID